ncbi:hypothetical protein JTE90_022469 [Oedothorax gibbosus]|uniref:Cysteine-rich and transmembrane domain-containing protein 1 n=1 Tax=Oedothorax gibbosus TaxID=931172 RepID=A0AAV6TUP1_9ARAC|nr:hypothetical protein JTE90_022469 [Oedothorax gibbosus]
MAYPPQPTYSAYDQQPPQPCCGYPPNPQQPYYPQPPQPGSHQQPGCQPQPDMPPTVAQPTGGSYYPGQPPTQTIFCPVHARQAEDGLDHLCLLWCGLLTCCCWCPLVCPCMFCSKLMSTSSTSE